MNETAPTKYMRPKPFALRTGVSGRTVYRWIDLKIIPSYKFQGVLLIDVDEVDLIITTPSSFVTCSFLFALMLVDVRVYTSMDSNFMTVNQVAAKYGVTRLTVIRLMEAGKFRANKFGSQWRIDRAGLEAYFQSNYYH
jgi:excisionase family DNA binding protein